MQRLTKYSLLLKAVLKNTEDLNQRKDLLEMVSLQYKYYFTDLRQYLIPLTVGEPFIRLRTLSLKGINVNLNIEKENFLFFIQI